MEASPLLPGDTTGVNDDRTRPTSRSALPKCLTPNRTCALLASILALYLLVIIPAGGYGAVKLFNHLHFADFNPPPGSLLRWSQNAEWDSFNPGAVQSNDEYIVVRSVPACQSLLDPVRAVELYLFSAAIEALLMSSQGSELVPVYRGYFLPSYRNSSLLGGCNNDTTVFVFNLMGTTKEYVPDLRDLIAKTELSWSGRYTIDVTGVRQLMREMSNQVLSNLLLIDSICVPLGLLLFAIATRSILVIIVPVLGVLGTAAPALGASSLMHPHIKVTGFAPELMSCIVIALSIDFSLFLVCRVRQNREQAANAKKQPSHRTPSIDSQPTSAVSTAELGNVATDGARLPVPGDADPDAMEDAQVASSCCGCVASVYSVAGEVFAALKHVSHNVAISSIAVTIAFVGLAFIKTDFVRSIAIVCALGAFNTLLTGVFLIPAATSLLMPLDDAIKAKFACLAGCARPCRPRGTTDKSTQTSSTDPQARDSTAVEATPSAPQLPPRLGTWGTVARFATRRWALCLLATALVTAGFVAVNAYKLKWDDNFFASAPQHSATFASYVNMLDVFGGEVDTPLIVLFETSDATPVFGSRRYFPVFDVAVDCVLGNPTLQAAGVTLASLDAPNVLNGRRISAEYADILRQQPRFNPSASPAPSGSSGDVAPNPPSRNATRTASRTLSMREVAANETLDDDAAAYYVLLSFLSASQNSDWQSPGTVSFGVMNIRIPAGFTWGAPSPALMNALHEVVPGCIVPRMAALPASATATLKVGYRGPNDGSWYIMNTVMSQLPLEVGLTLGLLLVVIGVLFRSVFMAFQMVLTVAITVAISFGIAELIYTPGSYYSGTAMATMWPAIELNEHMFWLIVVLAFSVSCVLALDYDVFLITRVLEMREANNRLREASPEAPHVGDVECTVEAVDRNAYVITIAALIMIVTFGAMLFANTLMLNQFGVILAFTVIIDAFFVRPLVVPAMVAACSAMKEGLIWWPRRMTA